MMDDAVKNLTDLLRRGVINPQTYADGLSALGKERPTPALQKCTTPTPAQRKQRPMRLMTDEELDKLIEEIYEDMPAPSLVFKKTCWAIGDHLRGWQMDVPEGYELGADPKSFLEGVRPQIRKKLTEEILVLKGVKFQLALWVQLSKASQDGTEEFTSPVLRNKQEGVIHAHEIGEVLDRAFPRINETLEKWTQRGSGWSVDRVGTLWLDIAQYQPLRGGSYIPLPAAMRNKLVVVNVKNKDDHCLRWALRAALSPVAKDPQRPTKYPTNDSLDFTGIDSPTPISQILRVEKQYGLAINVFGWDKGVIIHQLSKQPGDRINLLMIEKAGKFHYTWVKDFNRLLHDQSKYKHHQYFCKHCLHGYSREDLLEAHKPECRGISQTTVRVEMPEEGKNKLAFQNHHKQLPAPYVIYADFEAQTIKI